MIRSALVRRLAQKRVADRTQAELIVDVVFACFTQAMLRGEQIDIRGLGTFRVRSYKGYKGRNPKTGEQIEVRPKRLPHFKPAKELLSKINLLFAKRGSSAQPPHPGLATQAAKTDRASVRTNVTQ
jgi:integration host factor subunit beta